MSIEPPTSEDLRRVAEKIGMSLDGEEADAHLAALGPFFAVYAALDALPEELPVSKYPREAIHRPVGDENRWNAWYVKARVRGAESGPLSGKTVAIKDNVMLAGVPLLNGASIFDGYVPEIDATIVARILDAGGEILGKANCECLCASAGSHTGAAGHVENPHRPGYSAGGSSSGSAALVAGGEVDLAIGGDQGGSIRIPAALCGVYGMKPTHGLVPYTGVLPIEPTIDHVGPITASVRDNALMLEVIAGADGIDPRQTAPVTHRYSELCDGGVAGLRIGLLREGFGHADSEPDVDEKVRNAARLLEKLGADVHEISIPEHMTAGLIFLPLLIEGSHHTLIDGDGFGAGRQDLYVTSLMDHLRGARSRLDELHEVVKGLVLAGAYVVERHGYRYYGKAMQLRRHLRAAYDRQLADTDLLLLPTTPMKATPLPPEDASRELLSKRASQHSTNTFPFDITHHPAMSIPCGMSEGLPVGMMLVGRHWQEPTIYRTARAFEAAEDWRTL